MSESELFNQAKEKIMQWLSEGEEKQILQVSEEPPDKYNFLRLRIDYKDPSATTVLIAPRPEYIDKIMLMWRLVLHPNHRIRFGGFDSSVKERVRTDLQYSIYLMHIDLATLPDIENLEAIDALKPIWLDGISKHIIADALVQMQDAYHYTMYILGGYGLFQPK